MWFGTGWDGNLPAATSTPDPVSDGVGHMADRRFKSWRDYSTFAGSTRLTSRYIRTRRSAAFLKTVLETSGPFQEIWPIGTLVFRAQLGHDWETEGEGDESFEVPGPFGPERMLPLRNAASEGRANPKGISCVYVATDLQTAAAEVRPWIRSLVSVGRFELQRDLRLVNFTVGEQRKSTFYFREPSPEERAAAVWAEIDSAFSRPVTPGDTTADYAPTQVIAELFKAAGFDGIAYRSALGAGLNAALFDRDSVCLRTCTLYEVASLKFAFEQYSNPYFLLPGGSGGDGAQEASS